MTLQPVPAAEHEQEEEWLGMIGALDLATPDADADASAGELQQRRATVAVDKKRQRQLRAKPGWYRRVSQHVSKGAKRRIRSLWPRFGIEAPPWSVALDIPALFAPRPVERVVVEVGFGGGDCLVPLAQELARTQPGVAFIGFEWHVASMGAALARLERADVPNVKVFRGDVLHHLRAGWFGPAAVDEVLVVCPDPWPKEADWPRRVVNPESVALLAACVRPGGYMHVATDVLDYAQWVGRVLEAAAGEWEACAVPEDSVLFQSAPKPLTYREDEDEDENDDRLEDERAEAQEAEEETGQRRAREAVAAAALPEAGAADSVDACAPLPAHYHHAPELVREIHGLLPERPRWRPVTRYESRGVTELGHSIYDMCYRRKG